MKIPEFTAELAVRQGGRQYRKIIEVTNARVDVGGVVPQYFDGHHCWWQCWPGSGCEYICQDFPY